MQKIESKLFVAAGIGILFATGIMFSHAFTKTKLGTPIALGEAEYGRESSNETDNEPEAKEPTEAPEANEPDEAPEAKEPDERKTVKVRTAENSQQDEQEDDQENDSSIDEQDDDNNDVQEDIASFNKKIAKIEAKIAPLASSDPKSFDAFNASLGEIKILMAQVATTKDAAQLKSLTEVIEYKIERLTKLMEIIFEQDDEQATETSDDDSQDVAKQYGSSVSQFVHALKTIEETDNKKDNGIGEQVRVVAQAQNESQIKVEKSIKDINKRSKFEKFLVGPNYGSLATVQAAITENQTRINVLTEIMNQITDPVVRLVLKDQIASLQYQNTKLQTFVSSSEDGVSLFGWLAKMLN